MGKTKVVAIMTQKGGAGKSTLSNALILDYCMKQLLKTKKMPKVLLIDSDRQNSNADLRDGNMAILKMSIPGPEFDALPDLRQEAAKEVKTQYFGIRKALKNEWRAYDLFRLKDMDTEPVINAIRLIEGGEYDFVFIDFAGSVADLAADFLPYINYIIVPTNISSYDINSNKQFVDLLKEEATEEGSLSNLKAVRFVFNKYSLNQKKKNDIVEKELIEYSGFPFLKTRVRETSLLESFSYNTVVPVTYRLNFNTGEIKAVEAAKNIRAFTDEVMKLIEDNPI